MVFKCFNEKTFRTGIKNENMSDQQLAEELQKPIIKKFKNLMIFYWQYLGC